MPSLHNKHSHPYGKCMALSFSMQLASFFASLSHAPPLAAAAAAALRRPLRRTAMEEAPSRLGPRPRPLCSSRLRATGRLYSCLSASSCSWCVKMVPSVVRAPAPMHDNVPDLLPWIKSSPKCLVQVDNVLHLPGMRALYLHNSSPQWWQVYIRRTSWRGTPILHIKMSTTASSHLPLHCSSSPTNSVTAACRTSPLISSNCVSLDALWRRRRAHLACS